MSQIRNGIFVALAVTAMCGAVPFAAGQELTGRALPGAHAPETGINRSAKTDRDAVKAAPQTQTIVLRIDSLPDTSVLVRVRAVTEAPKDEARNRPAAPSMLKSGGRKPAVACEPVVSVLTEVAKLLQPGRCVT